MPSRSAVAPSGGGKFSIAWMSCETSFVKGCSSRETVETLKSAARSFSGRITCWKNLYRRFFLEFARDCTRSNCYRKATPAERAFPSAKDRRFPPFCRRYEARKSSSLRFVTDLPFSSKTETGIGTRTDSTRITSPSSSMRASASASRPKSILSLLFRSENKRAAGAASASASPSA